MSSATLSDAPWQPTAAAMEKVDTLMRTYRSDVVACLEPAVESHYPELLEQADPTGADDEYRKMVELSTKMTLVGHACSEIAGYPYDTRRRTIGSLFGACC